MTTVIDAVEAWMAGQSFWVQVPILLAVLLPLCWLVAGVVDRAVEQLLRRHTVREQAARVQAESSRPPR